MQLSNMPPYVMLYLIAKALLCFSEEILSNMPPFKVSPEEHKKRSEMHSRSAKELLYSLENYLKNFDPKAFKNVHFGAELPDAIPMQTSPKWEDYPFGARGTVGSSGCMVFMAWIILHYAGINVSIEQIVKSIVILGYRMWKLKNRSRAMSFPTIDLEQIKATFPDDPEIQACNTLEELYKVAGEPWGIGGSVYYIDNLIHLILNDDSTATRITSVEAILQNLKNGIPVPCRVQNSTYHNDPNRKEGHYVTWFAIRNGNAIIADSNYGNGWREMPVKQFLEALKGGGLTCAWDLKGI